MADLGSLVTIAEMVFQLLQSPILKSMKDWKSDLQNLNKSVSFIKNMLLDADMKPELSHVEQAWVEELKEVLYDAEDLFDEVITIAKQKKLHAGANFSKKIVDKVSRFFSSNNPILVSYNTSQEVKSIQRKLDAIARNHARYDLKADHQATSKRKVETCSFLDETHEKIIGREDDVKSVLDMLLDPNVEENVGFVVVVGMGGMGKTALAQLVYNHDTVGTRFEKKLWTCVSDQDGKTLDVQAILGNIIESSTNKKPNDVSTMQSIQTKLEEELKNKKYLLILDDVWTENPNKWSQLKRFLTIGGRGSRVVITTRSEKTAEVILGNAAHSKEYKLEGLSPEDSWRLFMLTAFDPESDQSKDPELTNIGKKIVEKCSNVPLSIKVIGTLLYGQTHRWEAFEKNRLLQIETSNNPITAILKLSYNNLKPSLKNCFKYCALFPKDFRMTKQELIGLWRAQGYINDTENDFLILLKRCFFQDVLKDEFGDVESFKMHDLLHDLAQELAGDEIIVANSCPPNKLSKKSRHVYIYEQEWTKSSFREMNIRTCYMNMWIHLDVVNTIAANWRYLRTLRLCMRNAKSLSESIGELLHLRYLDLSHNWNLKTLPNSISKLINLQYLILDGCYSLAEWPKYFCKLVNLRLLSKNGCPKLVTLPLGIGQMINLHYLRDFVVGSGASSIGKQIGVELKDLKFLVHLRGKLDITIDGDLASEKVNVWEGGYLDHIKNLKAVDIYFSSQARETNSEALIEKLQPNRNLMYFHLNGCNATEIPRWGRAQDDWAIILPNLVKIELKFCKLTSIPLLSNLKHLKILFLFELNNLEYMVLSGISHGSSWSEDKPFFPSLEHLEISGFRRLKGWWEGVGEYDSSSGSPHWKLRFPRLSILSIFNCPELTSFPPCPSLESLKIKCSNKSLRILPGEGPVNLDLKLRVEGIDSVDYLTTLPSCRLTHIKIDNHRSKGFLEGEDVFKSLSSLPSLEIKGCIKLTSLSGVLGHLTALESLSLSFLSVLVFDDIPWRSLRHNLRSLRLDCLSLKNLPTGMKHLTALQKLVITRCHSLKGLPELSCLSSLQFLVIGACGDLTEACEEPSGKEWPNIQHIPHISLCY